MAVNSLFYSLCGGATFKNDSSSGTKKKKTAQGRQSELLSSLATVNRISPYITSTSPPLRPARPTAAPAPDALAAPTKKKRRAALDFFGADAAEVCHQPPQPPQPPPPPPPKATTARRRRRRRRHYQWSIATGSLTHAHRPPLARPTTHQLRRAGNERVRAGVAGAGEPIQMRRHSWL